MADLEKVIKGLQCIIDGTIRCESCGYAIDKHGHHSCHQKCAKEAITLLKEQADEIKILHSDLNDLQKEHEKLLDKKIPLITNGQEVVRCKDCKHLEHMYALDELNGKKCYVCRKHSFTGLREEDWFCADGKRREDDA